MSEIILNLVELHGNFNMQIYCDILAQSCINFQKKYIVF